MSSKITEYTNVKLCLMKKSDVCNKMHLSSAQINVKKRHYEINTLMTFQYLHILPSLHSYNFLKPSRMNPEFNRNR
jgi:hypothetical protein